jgi:hypothetical protein
MTPILITGAVSNTGALVFDAGHKDRLRRVALTMRGQRFQIALEPEKRKRSQRQNAWHWAVAVPMIAAACGYEPHDQAGRDAVHYGLVMKCFGSTHHPQLGDVPNVRSSHLTTAQFSELMEWEARFAATEFGLYLPMPDECAA